MYKFISIFLILVASSVSAQVGFEPRNNSTIYCITRPGVAVKACGQLNTLADPWQVIGCSLSNGQLNLAPIACKQAFLNRYHRGALDPGESPGCTAELEGLYRQQLETICNKNPSFFPGPKSPNCKASYKEITDMKYLCGTSRITVEAKRWGVDPSGGPSGGNQGGSSGGGDGGSQDGSSGPGAPSWPPVPSGEVIVYGDSDIVFYALDSTNQEKYIKVTVVDGLDPDVYNKSQVDAKDNSLDTKINDLQGDLDKCCNTSEDCEPCNCEQGNEDPDDGGTIDSGSSNLVSNYSPFTPSPGNLVDRHKVTIPFDASRVELNLIVTHGDWDSELPSGIHGLFWLAHNCKYRSNTYGYVTTRGPRRNRLSLFSNTGLEQGKSRTSRKTIKLQPNTEYRYSFVYDGTSGRSTLVVRGGGMRQELSYDIPRELIPKGLYCIDLGLKRMHSDVPTLGWEYRDLQLIAYK